MKRLNESANFKSEDLEDVLNEFQSTVAENTGGADIPDAGDIPGGFFNSGQDLLEGVYSAWQEYLIEKQIKDWMKVHNKTCFP